jgi:exodeoxyribonuclease VII large subunit
MNLTQRRVLRQPLDRLHTLEQKLDEQGERLRRAIAVYFDRKKQNLQHTAARLDSLSPLNVLQRGYSLTVIESSETLLRSADQVQAGERIVTRLAHGKLVSRVEKTMPGEEKSR